MLLDRVHHFPIRPDNGLSQQSGVPPLSVVQLIMTASLLFSRHLSLTAARPWGLCAVSCSKCNAPFMRSFALSQQSLVHISSVYCCFSFSFSPTYRAGILRSLWRSPELWPGACGKSPACSKLQPLQPRWDLGETALVKMCFPCVQRCACCYGVIRVYTAL